MRKSKGETARTGRPIAAEFAIPAPKVSKLQAALLEWYATAKRDLPWRRTRDPYAIWVSEIMLQQTRVAAVLPYYHRFLQRFPDVMHLADAPEADLLAAWAGLGYYSRARNMQRAARLVVERGGWPGTYNEILALPGIGPYTAAAIASIAWEQPVAVVDGNVYRVLSRVFNDSTDIAASSAYAHFSRLAQSILPPATPGESNQALMELGATICLPKRPQCLLCPLAAMCRARRNGNALNLPVKSRRAGATPALRKVFWVERDGKLLLWQRPPAARLMAGFWELPEAEHLPNIEPRSMLGSFKHGITTHAYTIEIWGAQILHEAVPGLLWIAPTDFAELPISTVVRKALEVVAPKASAARTMNSR